MEESGPRHPASRPGIPCLIPVKLFTGEGEGEVDGVITRISEMAASVTVERPIEGSTHVDARFRRPKDRCEIAIPAQVIGVSHEGGIWRGRPSLVLKFGTALVHAPLADATPVGPPPSDPPLANPDPPIAAPLEAPPIAPLERGAAPPGDPPAIPDPDPLTTSPDPAPEATGPSPLPGEPFEFERASGGFGDFDFEQQQAPADDWSDIPEPVPDARDDWRDPWQDDRESDDSAELLPPPITAAVDAPEPEAFGFSVPGMDDDPDESTIDRLQLELQRSERRILTSLPVTFFAAGDERHGLACNFSPGGVYLAAEIFPPIGSVIHVLFPARTPAGDEREVAFNGVVRWYRKDRPDLDLPDGFGLQIISFQSAEDRWLFTSFARKIAAAAARI